MQVFPLLCFPHESTEMQIDRLSLEMQNYKKFDPVLNYVAPQVTREYAQKTFNIRMEILKMVYKNEYYSDSFDIDRLVNRIKSGNELIWFWGSKSEVEKLVSYFNASEHEDFKQFFLGTITVINSAEEFGYGTAELCRCGSTTFHLSGNPPLIYQMWSYLSKTDIDFYNKYHTICFVPRTRKSEGTVRGGEAVKIIYTNHLRSRFWGFAPWYVMQGGVLELLEYREINRDIADVIRAIQTSSHWYVTDKEEAMLVKNLCLLNFDLHPNILANADQGDINQIKAKLISIKDENIKALNHETLICYSDEDTVHTSDVYDFNTLLNILLKNESSCKVVRLSLLDIKLTTVQNIIKALGFKLMLISPPKHTWYIDDKGEKIQIKTPPYGFWCLPNNTIPLAFPYYINSQPYNMLEKNILNYYKEIFNTESRKII